MSLRYEKRHAVLPTREVGTSYMIIIMYLNIVIISYYILLLLHYKHLRSVKELWSFTGFKKVRLNEKKRNVSPNPSMTLLLWFCNLYLLQSLCIWQIESEPGSGRCYTNHNVLNQVWESRALISHENIWETHHMFLLTWSLLVKI